MSKWVEQPQGTDVFEDQFAPIREAFRPSLSHAYRILGNELKKNMDLDPSLPLLYLGIGTGQEASMLGIPASRIFAIDASGEYLQRAQKPDRLPGLAGTLQGIIPDVLDSLHTFHPVIFASEMLDCIPPSEFSQTAKALKEHGATVVVSQSLGPDPEFYETHFNTNALWSVGGSGIEGWTTRQRTLVEDKLQHEFGITADPFALKIPDNPANGFDPTQATLLLNQLQKMVEKRLGYQFTFTFGDALQTVFPMDKSSVPNVAQNLMAQSGIPLEQRSYISRITGFVSLFEKALGQLRDVTYTQLTSLPTQTNIQMYARVHTLHRFSQILEETLIQESHFTIVENELRQAGYTLVERKAIATDNNGQITDAQLAQSLERAFTVAFFQASRTRDIERFQEGQQNRVFVLGTPAIFLDPLANAINVSRIQYLVAA